MSILKRRGQDGAVAIEAALVTPILLILVFGIIEFSFAMRDYVVVASDARVGARIASAGAAFGDSIDCRTDPELPCVSGESVPALAQAAAKAIQTSGSAMPMENINYILVYEANPDGYPGTLSSMPTSCSGVRNCVRFTWRPGANPATDGKFVWAGGSWSSGNISACFPGTSVLSADGKKRTLDKVGVQVHTTHPGMTGIFFDELTLEDHAVLNFEPLPDATCGEGQRVVETSTP